VDGPAGGGEGTRVEGPARLEYGGWGIKCKTQGGLAQKRKKNQKKIEM